MQRVKAVLLAAGLGTRLRPLTDHTPKCLVPVAGRPLLAHWFDALSGCGIKDVLINTHHLPEQVREYLDIKRLDGFAIMENYEPTLLGSAGTIHVTRSWADDADDVLIIYADNYSTLDLAAMLAFHRSHGDPFTMALFHAPVPRACGIAQLGEGGRITEFIEKPANPLGDLANAGVYVVSADAFHEMADADKFDLGYDVLPLFVGRMRGFVMEGYHRDIGTSEALADVQQFAGGIQYPHQRVESGFLNQTANRPAVFLDRDGTLIEHVHHLIDPAAVRLIAGAAQALRLLQSAGYECVVVTNQSVVGRGLLDEEGLERVHQRLSEQLAAAGVTVGGLYFCPHVPDQDDPEVVEHPDRKPGPGMLQRAARELHLSLDRSWMIGDSISDLVAGRNAGCRGSILVLTGQGASVPQGHHAADHVAADLGAAAKWILDQDELADAGRPIRHDLA